VEWPPGFYDWKQGTDCPMCAEGRPEETPDAVRFHAGALADAYLRRANIQRGLSLVVWRGRHVAEPTELEDEESFRYWRDVMLVARAIEAVMEPVKLNFNLLGNSVPHLHTHIVPRYADDPRPGWPFPFPEEDPPDMREDLFRSDVDALRAALAAASSRQAQR
jgi:diadenosine tetraphosphate (Ap4A) HIT family hydrolase